MPDFEFLAETGKSVKFSDYRGSALAFSFFFTSCPLPEYCPRMNQNFAAARRLLIADTNAPANWQLLCISFDPAFDKPEILSSYAGIYREGNADRWLFVAASTNTLAELAPRVDLSLWREKGTISHNLRTVVLDRSGKIFRQFDGNEWTAQQLADALSEAAKANTP
jgi:protein SCO1/2